MLEIFVPIKIKGYGNIQNISDNCIQVIQEHFYPDRIEHFESDFLSGYKMVFRKMNKSLISLCNGEFGNKYYVDYDMLEHKNIPILGTHVAKSHGIGVMLTESFLQVGDITNVLKSKKLLTFSKKEEICSQIENSFFALAHIDYVLTGLLLKVDENIGELGEYSGKSEYESQASLLGKQNDMFRQKISGYKVQFDTRIGEFISIVSKFTS